MPTGEERRLKLVKATPTVEPTAGSDDREATRAEATRAEAGYLADGAQPPADEARASADEARPPARRRRQPARRTVTRRVPEARDPVESILQRLDREPAAPDPEPADAPATDAAPADTAPTDATADDTHATDAPGIDADSSGVQAAPTPSADASERRVGRWIRLGRRPRPPAGRPAPGRWPAATVGLAAVLVVALAGAGFLGYQWYQDRAVEQARAHALAAARQTTVNFVSVSASSVDSDLQRITAGAAGEFKEEFTRGQAQVRAAVIENKVESTGTVLRAALVSGDRRAAVALVAVDATVKNVHAPDGRAAHYRIQVDLTRDRDSGAWLVSRLQFVG
jgi:Mce-associated membrane protein